jgi:hypothetical protein
LSKSGEKGMAEASKEKPSCPFLEAITYKSRKGGFTKYYCKSRGYRDLLNKKIAMNICQKSAYCIIRQNVEKLLKK